MDVKPKGARTRVNWTVLQVVENERQRVTERQTDTQRQTETETHTQRERQRETMRDRDKYYV